MFKRITLLILIKPWTLALVKSENRLVILEILLTVSLKAHACFDRPEY